jgi:hypothetical protein
MPELPQVDFSREVVVVAALGQRPTGGFNILIESAAATRDGVTVSIRATAPGPGCGVTLALTQPVDIARMPRRGAVQFHERADELACR